MRQLAVHGPGDVRLDDVPAPEPGPRDAVVSVSACGICGSDLSYIKRGGIPGGASPMPLGHEVAGVVSWVGGEVPDVLVGDRVVVHPGLGEADLGVTGNGGTEGGLTDSLYVRDAARGGRLFPVPDDLPLSVAAMTEPVAVGMHAANLTEAVAGEKVAVFGCGPIGLAAIATLVDRGVEAVGVDLSARRLALAAGIGAQAVLDPNEVDVWEALADLHGTAPSISGPTPATHAFVEASGSGRVITDLIDRARAGGRLSVPAVHYQPVSTSFLSIMAKQLQIRGSLGYPERFQDAMDLLLRKDLSSLLTHRYGLEQYADAFDVLGGDKNCGKVMLVIGDDSSSKED